MILRTGFLNFSIAISFKCFFAEDLGMNADPYRPHQRKELPSNLGLTQLVCGGILL
jgi:hypothetical protein